MPRVKTREAATPVQEFAALALRYIILKSKIKISEAEVSSIKGQLDSYVDQTGEETSDGHKVVTLPEVFEGVRAIKRERRSSQTVNAKKTREILHKKGLEDRCYYLDPVLDQDEVMECVREGLITDDELSEMFPEKVSWATVMEKA